MDDDKKEQLMKARAARQSIQVFMDSAPVLENNEGVCCQCKQKIAKVENQFSGAFYQSADGQIHQECWEIYSGLTFPKCLHCTEPVAMFFGRFSGEAYDVGQEYVHTECWRDHLKKFFQPCAQCGEPCCKLDEFSGATFQMEEGLEVHVECHEDYSSKIASENFHKGAMRLLVKVQALIRGQAERRRSSLFQEKSAKPVRMNFWERYGSSKDFKTVSSRKDVLLDNLAEENDDKNCNTSNCEEDACGTIQGPDQARRKMGRRKSDLKKSKKSAQKDNTEDIAARMGENKEKTLVGAAEDIFSLAKDAKALLIGETIKAPFLQQSKVEPWAIGGMQSEAIAKLSADPPVMRVNAVDDRDSSTASDKQIVSSAQLLAQSKKLLAEVGPLLELAEQQKAETTAELLFKECTSALQQQDAGNPDLNTQTLFADVRSLQRAAKQTQGEANAALLDEAQERNNSSGAFDLKEQQRVAKNAMSEAELRLKEAEKAKEKVVSGLAEAVKAANFAEDQLVVAKIKCNGATPTAEAKLQVAKAVIEVRTTKENVAAAEQAKKEAEAVVLQAKHELLLSISNNRKLQNVKERPVVTPAVAQQQRDKAKTYQERAAKAFEDSIQVELASSATNAMQDAISGLLAAREAKINAEKQIQATEKIGRASGVEEQQTSVILGQEEVLKSALGALEEIEALVVSTKQIKSVAAAVLVAKMKVIPGKIYVPAVEHETVNPVEAAQNAQIETEAKIVDAENAKSKAEGMFNVAQAQYQSSKSSGWLSLSQKALTAAQEGLLVARAAQTTAKEALVAAERLHMPDPNPDLVQTAQNIPNGKPKSQDEFTGNLATAKSINFAAEAQVVNAASLKAEAEEKLLAAVERLADESALEEEQVLTVQQAKSSVDSALLAARQAKSATDAGLVAAKRLKPFQGEVEEKSVIDEAQMLLEALGLLFRKTEQTRADTAGELASKRAALGLEATAPQLGEADSDLIKEAQKIFSEADALQSAAEQKRGEAVAEMLAFKKQASNCAECPGDDVSQQQLQAKERAEQFFRAQLTADEALNTSQGSNKKAEEQIKKALETCKGATKSKGERLSTARKAKTQAIAALLDAHEARLAAQKELEAAKQLCKARPSLDVFDAVSKTCQAEEDVLAEPKRFVEETGPLIFSAKEVAAEVDAELLAKLEQQPTLAKLDYNTRMAKRSQEEALEQVATASQAKNLAEIALQQAEAKLFVMETSEKNAAVMECVEAKEAAEAGLLSALQAKTVALAALLAVKNLKQPYPNANLFQRANSIPITKHILKEEVLEQLKIAEQISTEAEEQFLNAKDLKEGAEVALKEALLELSEGKTAAAESAKAALIKSLLATREAKSAAEAALIASKRVEFFQNTDPDPNENENEEKQKDLCFRGHDLVLAVHEPAAGNVPCDKCSVYILPGEDKLCCTICVPPYDVCKSCGIPNSVEDKQTDLCSAGHALVFIVHEPTEGNVPCDRCKIDILPGDEKKCCFTCVPTYSVCKSCALKSSAELSQPKDGQASPEDWGSIQEKLGKFEEYTPLLKLAHQIQAEVEAELIQKRALLNRPLPRSQDAEVLLEEASILLFHTSALQTKVDHLRSQTEAERLLARKQVQECTQQYGKESLSQGNMEVLKLRETAQSAQLNSGVFRSEFQKAQEIADGDMNIAETTSEESQLSAAECAHSSAKAALVAGLQAKLAALQEFEAARRFAAALPIPETPSAIIEEPKTNEDCVKHCQYLLEMAEFLLETCSENRAAALSELVALQQLEADTIDGSVVQAVQLAGAEAEGQMLSARKACDDAKEAVLNAADLIQNKNPEVSKQVPDIFEAQCKAEMALLSAREGKAAVDGFLALAKTLCAPLPNPKLFDAALEINSTDLNSEQALHNLTRAEDISQEAEAQLFDAETDKNTTDALVQSFQDFRIADTQNEQLEEKRVAFAQAVKVMDGTLLSFRQAKSASDAALLAVRRLLPGQDTDSMEDEDGEKDRAASFVLVTQTSCSENALSSSSEKGGGNGKENSGDGSNMRTEDGGSGSSIEGDGQNSGAGDQKDLEGSKEEDQSKKNDLSIFSGKDNENNEANAANLNDKCLEDGPSRSSSAKDHKKLESSEEEDKSKKGEENNEENAADGNNTCLGNDPSGSISEDQGGKGCESGQPSDMCEDAFEEAWRMLEEAKELQRQAGEAKK